MSVRERLGRNVLRCRLRVGLSQEALSYRAGLHRTEIGMLERGVRLPRIDTVIKLAVALEVEIAELVAGIDWVPDSREFSGEFLVSPIDATENQTP